MNDPVASPTGPAVATTGVKSRGWIVSLLTNENSTIDKDSSDKPIKAAEQASYNDEWKKVIPSSYVKLKEPSYMKFSSK